jgi:hypothetical protein
MSACALERLVARPAGRRHTTVAIYRSAAAARSAVTRLHHMGVDTDKLSLVGKEHLSDEQDVPCVDLSADLSENLLSEDGLSVLGTELVRLGVSRESAINYQADFLDGKSLLIVHGTLAETGRAAELLEKTMHHGLAEHEA